MQNLINIIKKDKKYLKNITGIDAYFLSKEIFHHNKDKEYCDFLHEGIVKYLKENKHDNDYEFIREKILIHLVDTSLLIDKSEIYKELLSDYKESIKDYTEKFSQMILNIPSDKVSDYLKERLIDYQKINKILEEIQASSKNFKLNEFKEILPNEIATSGFGNLKEIIKDENNKKLLDSSIIIQFIRLKKEEIIKGEITNEELEKDLESIIQLRDKFAIKENKENCLTSIIGCLQSDLIKLYKNNGIKEDINDLWANIKRYSLNDINDLPKKEDLLYVLTEDNNLYISPDKQNGETIQHIMLSNGKAILMAGMLSIDENNNIVKINNSSGHFRPTIDRAKHLIGKLKNEENIDVIDAFSRDKKVKKLSEYQLNITKDKIKELRQKNKESNNIDKVKNTF